MMFTLLLAGLTGAIDESVRLVSASTPHGQDSAGLNGLIEAGVVHFVDMLRFKIAHAKQRERAKHGRGLPRGKVEFRHGYSPSVLTATIAASM